MNILSLNLVEPVINSVQHYHVGCACTTLMWTEVITSSIRAKCGMGRVGGGDVQ